MSFGQSSGFSFGHTTQPAQPFAFGATGQTQPQGSALFGASTQQPTQSTSMFGAPKPAGLTFGVSAAPGATLFGTPAATSQQQTGLFGVTGGATAPQSSMFTAAGIGGAQLGTTVKFNPPIAIDTVQRAGSQQTVQTKHQCISAMKEYESKSMEELRVEDYTANRKGPAVGSTLATVGMFGAAQTQPAGFGITASSAGGPTLFSATSTQASGAGTLFGAGASTAKPVFGAATATAFGQPQQPAGSLFGAPKPTLFGATPATTTATPLFGAAPAASTGFAFGQTQQQTGLFGQSKPLFGATTTSAPSTAFGAFGTQATAGGLFGAKPATSGAMFGAPTTGFGAVASSAATPFSFSAQPGTSGGLFGQASQPPKTTLFGFGTQSTAATGFGFGATATTSIAPFGAPTGGLFGGAATSQPNKPLFGGAPATGLGLGAGLGRGGPLGGTAPGMFSMGATAAPGQLGLGLGMPGGQTAFGIPQAAPIAQPTSLGLSGNPVEAYAEQARIQQQVLDLVMNMPYGGQSSFFKDTLPRPGEAAANSRTSLSVPTNQEAQKAAQMRLSLRPISRPKTKLLPSNRKQLFSGFDEEDAAHSSDSFFVRRSEWKRLDLPPSVRSGVDRSGSSTLPIMTREPPPELLLDVESSQDSRDQGLESTRLEEVVGVQVGGDRPEPRTTRTNTNDVVDSNTNASPPATQKIGSGKIALGLDSSLMTSEDMNVTWSPTAADADSSIMMPDSSGMPQHPCGIVLTKPGYYTLPTLDELADQGLDEGNALWVEDFVIGRQGYGRILFPGDTNLGHLNLDDTVHIRRKEVTVYPDDETKPSLNAGLNKRAEVTLDAVWPTDKTTRQPVRDAHRLEAIRFEEKLERATSRMGARFIEYRPDTGSWVFEVKHFSKYRYEESDDEDEPTSGTGDKRVTSSPQVANQKKMLFPAPTVVVEKKLPAPAQMGDVIAQEQAKKLADLEVDLDHEEMPDVLDDSEEEMGPDSNGVLEEPSSFRVARALDVPTHEVQRMKANLFMDMDEEEMQEDDYTYVGHQRKKFGYFDDSHEAAVTSSTSRPMAALDARSLLVTPRSRMLADVSSSMACFKSIEVTPPERHTLPSGMPTRVEAKPHVPLEMKMAGGRLHFPLTGLQMEDNYDQVTIDGRSIQLSRLVADTGCFHGPTLRVGWSPVTEAVGGLRFVTSAPDVTSSGLHTQGGLFARPSAGLGSGGQKLAIQAVHLDIQAPDEDLLNRALQTSVFSQDEDQELSMELEEDDTADSCPMWSPQHGLGPLDSYWEALRGALTSGEPLARLVGLCQALWGSLLVRGEDEAMEEEDESGGASQPAVRLARKQALSDWIRSQVSSSVDSVLESRPGASSECIFACLSGGQVERACQLAQSAREHRLALVMAGVQGAGTVRRMLVKQLEEWREMQVETHIPESYLRIYCLLAGFTVWERSEGVGERTQVLQDLDWMRCLGSQLWYTGGAQQAGIAEALAGYEQAFRPPRGDRQTMEDAQYVAKPWPIRCQKSRHWDCAFHLLQLFCERSHPLERLLDPGTMSGAPAHQQSLDWAASWHLWRVLHSLGYTQMSELRLSQLHLEWSSQLEHSGLWEWSVFPLLHLTCPKRRAVTIKQMLARHVTCDREWAPAERFLQERLRVPARWIHEAKAVLSRHQGNAELEAHHWFSAGHYDAAHRVCMEQLVPDILIAKRFDKMVDLLQPFQTDAISDQVTGWVCGGQLYLDHVYLREELSRLQQTNRTEEEEEGGMERLRLCLVSLCDRVENMPARTAKERLCQSEVSIYCSRLLSVFLSQSTDTVSALHQQARLLAQMAMPEDYGLQEARTLTAGILAVFGR